MKQLIKRYMRWFILLFGAVLLTYFGMKTVQLGLAKPQAPVTDGLTAEAAAQAISAFDELRSKWNNQFARKGFFALIGLFLLLLGAVPKKKIWIPKIVFSLGLMGLIFHHLLADGKIATIAEKSISLSVFWIVAAFVVKGTGMGCTVWRWKVLLEGQGFKIPLRHLIESFLIGRFIGSFAPGTSGLDGYRAYDISRYTGKVARSISVIFVEKLIGFFVLGTLLLIAVPLGQRLFAAKEVNATALVMMGLTFSGMMLLSLVILFKPNLIRWFVDKLIPRSSPVRKPFDKAIKAVTAYERRKLHLAKATLIGFGVHVCTIGMYFCTSRAIGFVPPSDDLFVTSALMIGATILPLSIAGIGMREGVFAFFLGPVAAIYAFTGYLVGEIISLFGGPVWLARRGNYYEVIQAQRQAINADVEEDEEPEADPGADRSADERPTGPPPSVREYGLTGIGAGLVAGLAVGLVDSVKLWTLSFDLSLPGYAALVYGLFLALVGGVFGAGLAILGRLVQKPAAPPRQLATFIGCSLFFVVTLAISAKFLHRDVFDEKAAMFSGRMLGSLAGSAVGLLALCLAVGALIRRVFRDSRERLLKLRYAAAGYGILTALLLVGAVLGDPDTTAPPASTAEDDQQYPNIILVMNDTHRADHVGAYGGPPDLTPHLDALARDGVVYTNAFAQSSWTRPSVATILTGRFPSSHTAVLKTSVLPDEVTTLAEALQPGGYESIGIVTNYNLTPFFNFHQGFSEYHYLAPSQPLGANDAQGKLFFIEVLKKVLARTRGKTEAPEDYYVVGEEVTQAALEQIDGRDSTRPFFMFLSYMDVHDPYFRHPFDGYGISHRANPNPAPEMAEEMKSLYAGEVKYWDRSFGALIDGLKSRGLYDETLIVVTSDHGEEFGEHGGFWHGTTLYDEQLRVIFIVKYPQSHGTEGGARVDSWMRLVDVAPLILQTAGLDVPEEMQGNPTPPSKPIPVFAEEDHQGNVLTSIRYVKEGQTFKLIQANPDNPRGLVPIELYDMSQDPLELQNLASEAKTTVVESAKLLDSAQTEALRGAAKAQSNELSTDAIKQLKAMGYIEEEKK